MNGESLAGALAAVRGEVPAALLDEAGALRLMEVAGTLPPVLARGKTGLELRLAGPLAADLWVGAMPHRSDGHALHTWARRSGLDTLARALDAWRSQFGWFAWHARHVLLGFDVASDTQAPPCIYLVPLGADDAGALAVPTNAFHSAPAGLIEALAALSGSPPDPRAVEDLERLLSLLPPYAEIFAAGAMLSRASVRAPRVAVRRLTAEGIGTLLTGLGRPEAAEWLVPAAAELGGLGARLALSLDVGAAASAVVGVEAHPGRRWAEGRAEGWAPVLDAVVARGLAERERADAAIGLPGPRWPGGPVLGLSHVKVSADAAGLRPAKLYLGFLRASAALDGRREGAPAGAAA